MSKLLTTWSRLLVLAALLLSGCFRPAGDSIQPTSGSAVDTVIPLQSNPTETPGAPPVTLLSPETPGATTSQAAPAITEVTVIPFQPTETATALPGTLTPTLQIITPGISLGMLTPDTVTPLPPESTQEAGTFETPLPLDTSATNPALVSGAACTYTVQAGDNLYRIALLNNTSVNAMMKANPDLTGNAPVLQPGQVLNLPDCVAGTSSPATISGGSDNTATPAGTTTYSVQPGDTLGAIASHFGVSVNAIMRANNLNNPNALSIGQKLIIPNQ